MSQDTTISIAAADGALDGALNALNGGFVDLYTDAPLLGTFSVTNGSSAVTASAAQTLPAGTILQFSPQLGTYYKVQTAVVGGTAIVLGTPGGAATPYTGTTSGTATAGSRPATPDTAPAVGNTKLAHLPLSATAFAPASGGVKTANAITSAAAIGTGTCTWFRAVKSDTTTGVIDGSAGTSGSDLNLTSTAIVSGTTVQCTSWTVTMPLTSP